MKGYKVRVVQDILVWGDDKFTAGDAVDTVKYGADVDAQTCFEAVVKGELPLTTGTAISDVKVSEVQAANTTEIMQTVKTIEKARKNSGYFKENK